MDFYKFVLYVSILSVPPNTDNTYPNRTYVPSRVIVAIICSIVKGKKYQPLLLLMVGIDHRPFVMSISIYSSFVKFPSQ